MTEDARRQAHELIDRLPERQLSGLVQFLEGFVDETPAQMESETPTDVAIEQVVAELGLTMDQIGSFRQPD